MDTIARLKATESRLYQCCRECVASDREELGVLFIGILNLLEPGGGRNWRGVTRHESVINAEMGRGAGSRNLELVSIYVVPARYQKINNCFFQIPPPKTEPERTEPRARHR